MAAKTNQVAVEIVAIDEASPKIDKLTKKIDGLESDEARIIITSNINRLEEQLEAAEKALAKLDGDEATVQARLVGNLQEDLEQANKLFDQLNGQTGTVTIKADTTQARQNIDDLGRSAGSSKSVLANMVGNTTQDVGQLGGVAGSAGVAIGQMGEYMADARLEGEKFSSILRNFAAVAGPIAAVSVALLAVNDIMKAMAQGQAATKAFDDQQVKDFTEAVEEGGSVIRNYNESLRDTGRVMADVGQKSGPAWTQILPGVDKLTDTLGLMGKFGEIIEDITPLLNRAGINARVWTETLTSDEPVAAMDKLRTFLESTTISADEQSKILIAARAAQDNYAQSVENTALAEQFFGKETKKTSGEVRGLSGVISNALDLQQDYLDAKEDLVDNIREEWQATREAAAAALQWAEKAQDAIDAAIDFKVAASEAGEELETLAENIDSLESANLADALDVGSGALDALTAVQDINQEFRDFAEWLKSPDGLKGVIPNIFDPADVNADDFLDKIGTLRGPIQEEIARVFGESGPGAATAVAESFVASLAEQTGLTKQQVTSLLGLDDLEAKIKISIEQSEIDQARTQLKILESLLQSFPGATLEDRAFVASVQLGLDAGTITGEQAQALIQPKLRNFGVVIPTELAVPDTEKVRREAQAVLDSGQPVSIPLVWGPGPSAASAGAPSQSAIPGGSFVINHNYPPGVQPTPVHTAGVDYYNRNGDRVGP